MHIFLETFVLKQRIQVPIYFRHPFLDKVYAEIPNKNTEMIVFPSFITHYANLSKTLPRITISFDLITKEYYDIIGGEYCVMG